MCKFVDRSVLTDLRNLLTHIIIVVALWHSQHTVYSMHASGHTIYIHPYTKFGDIACERDYMTVAVVGAFNSYSHANHFTLPERKREYGFLIESSKSQLEIRGDLIKLYSCLIDKSHHEHLKFSYYTSDIMFRHNTHIPGLYRRMTAIQWSPSITDTTGTKYFVLYSEVSFTQGVIVDHAPLIIVASYAGARLWTMKSVVLIKDLLIFSH